MLSRLATALNMPLLNQEASLADSGSISAWAVEAVGQVQAAGIMSGVDNNIFAPNDVFTREQSIVTIMRLFDMLLDQ